MARYALIVIDMLNDFVYGRLKCERVKRIIPNIRRVLEWARSKKIPVIYANDSHIPDVDLELKLWGPHAIRGSWGAQVIDELKPQPGDFIVEKRRYSAFFETDLDLLLRELGVDTVVLTGILTEICVKHTAADAFFRGYRVVVLEDCVEALSDEAQRWALDYMRRIYGAKVVSSSRFIEAVEKGEEL